MRNRRTLSKVFFLFAAVACTAVALTLGDGAGAQPGPDRRFAAGFSGNLGFNQPIGDIERRLDEAVAAGARVVRAGPAERQMVRGPSNKVSVAFGEFAERGVLVAFSSAPDWALLRSTSPEAWREGGRRWGRFFLENPRYAAAVHGIALLNEASTQVRGVSNTLGIDPAEVIEAQRRYAVNWAEGFREVYPKAAEPYIPLAGVGLANNELQSGQADPVLRAFAPYYAEDADGPLFEAATQNWYGGARDVDVAARVVRRPVLNEVLAAYERTGLTPPLELWIQETNLPRGGPWASDEAIAAALPTWLSHFHASSPPGGRPAVTRVLFFSPWHRERSPDAAQNRFLIRPGDPRYEAVAAWLRAANAASSPAR